MKYLKGTKVRITDESMLKKANVSQEGIITKDIEAEGSDGIFVTHKEGCICIWNTFTIEIIK